MGPYTPLNLLGIFVQSVFVENFVLANFLGMCSYLACSNKVKTAHNLGMAVAFVIAITGVLNWLIHRFITAPGALTWLSVFGIDASGIDLSFLEFLLFISIIAGFTQLLEIFIEAVSPSLYHTLGIYLPLIAVNCALLGVCLFAFARDYPFIPNLVYMIGSGIGWWLAIVLMAAIRQKLAYSKVVPGLEGFGITFIASGIMAMAFMGLSGINLRNPSTGEVHPHFAVTATPKIGQTAGSNILLNPSAAKHKIGQLSTEANAKKQMPKSSS